MFTDLSPSARRRVAAWPEQCHRSAGVRRYPYLTLFCVSAGLYLLALKTYFGYDGQMMFRVTESLALHHTLRVVDPIWHVNEPYATYGLGVPLLLIPFFWLGQVLTHDGTRLAILYEPVVTAATVAALGRLLGELGCSWWRRVVLCGIYAFGTLAWYYSTTIFAEPLVGLSLVVTLLGFVHYRRTGQAIGLLIAGIAVAVAMVARVDSAVMIAIPCFAYVVHLVQRSGASIGPRIGRLAAFVTPAAAGAAVDLGYNWLRYGNVFDAGHLPYPGTFNTPVWAGLYGLLLSPGAGLLIYCPVAVLGLVGCWWFVRRFPAEAILIIGLIAIRLLFYARWDAWMGLEWGARFLMPVVPLFIIPLAFLPRRRWLDIATGVTAGLGVAIEVLGQLVPYDTVLWPRLAPAVAAALHLNAPGGCICSSDVDLKVHEAMATNWQFAPLRGQWQILMSGDHIAWGYVALLAGGLSLSMLVLRRLATAAPEEPALDQLAA